MVPARPQPARLLTAKELSGLTGLTTDSIRRNQVRLGIVHYRIAVNQRLIFFRAEPTLAALVAAGLVVVTNGTLAGH